MRIDFRKTVELSTDEATRKALTILFYIENKIMMSKLNPECKYKLQIGYRKSYVNPLGSKFSVSIVQSDSDEIIIDIKNLECESWDVFDKLEEILNESGYDVNRYEHRPVFGSRQWHISIEF